MAAPNLIAPQTITGKTALATLGTSSAAILSNGSSSNKLLKVNIIRASNYGTINNTYITITYKRSASEYYLVDEALVELGTSLVLTNKEEYIYLEEGDSIWGFSSQASSVNILLHYEEIS